MQKKDRRRSFFTIIELVVAMAIFAILMLILMQIFNSTQDVWRKTNVKTDSYENARIALDMIEADLQSAIYVDNPTGSGESFHFANNELWFPTIKPYTTEANQKLKEVEVMYKFRNNTSAENTQENIPSGLTVGKLEYYVNTDTSGALDFRTNNNAHSTNTANPKGIILENILAWQVLPLYRHTDNSYRTVTDKLPHIVLVSFKVIDNDLQIMRKYLDATGSDKDLYTRTFSRIISIDRPMVYSITPAAP